MGPWQALMLGVIQGVTEFLPVSSSGHLVIFQHLFGLKEPELFFDVSVHLGTLVAVIIFFREEIQTIIVSIGRFLGLLFRKKASVSYINENADLKLAFLIIIGSIPTVFLGLLFHRIVDQLFSSVVLVGMMLLVTGSLLWSTRWIKKEGRNIACFSVRDALFIGLMQGVAIMPGISRSGSTIAAGLFAGLNRETAARYSFLLFIPAVLGAEILSLKDLPDYRVFSNLVTLLGAITSCIVGYGALGLLLRLVKQGRLYFFAPYCWLAGMITLILGW
jgi:undecaprenyl-diphosphatase